MVKVIFWAMQTLPGYWGIDAPDELVANWRQARKAVCDAAAKSDVDDTTPALNEFNRILRECIRVESELGAWITSQLVLKLGQEIVDSVDGVENFLLLRLHLFDPENPDDVQRCEESGEVGHRDFGTFFTDSRDNNGLFVVKASEGVQTVADLVRILQECPQHFPVNIGHLYLIGPDSQQPARVRLGEKC